MINLLFLFVSIFLLCIIIVKNIGSNYIYFLIFSEMFIFLIMLYLLIMGAFSFSVFLFYLMIIEFVTMMLILLF